jgi:hypothetical protein
LGSIGRGVSRKLKEVSLLDYQILGRGNEDFKAKVDMVIFGRSGAGKTFWAATAPSPFIISPDPTGHKSVPYAIPGKVINTLDEVGIVLDWFESGGHMEHDIKTLIVDGVSFFYDIYTKEMGQYFVDYHGAKDVDMMPIAARMKISNGFKRMLRRMVNLTQNETPVHVIFTTLDERLKEDEKADFQIRPHFGSAKMNETFPAYFSVIAYIEPVGDEDEQGNPSDERKVLFTEYHGTLARDRLGLFPKASHVAVNLSDYLS